MKIGYQAGDEVGKQRSIRKVREIAEQGSTVQLVLPLLEVMQLVQDGCGQLLRRGGLAFDDAGDGRRGGAIGRTMSSAG